MGNISAPLHNCYQPGVKELQFSTNEREGIFLADQSQVGKQTHRSSRLATFQISAPIDAAKNQGYLSDLFSSVYLFF